MNIFLHDYAGHPFTAELARELARRGHTVIYAYFANDPGPKGRLELEQDDPSFLTFLPIKIDGNYSKKDLLKRRSGDIRYGGAVSREFPRINLDLVISANTPTEAQEQILRVCLSKNIPFVYWCQDFYSIAVFKLLEAKLPVFGHVIAAWYRRLERRQMQHSSHIVLISEEFRKQTKIWGMMEEKISFIPNWGLVDLIKPQPRNTSWASRQGLSEGTRYIYSGTLARKHNPELLAALCKAIEPNEEVVMVSAGIGADQLISKKMAGSLPRLRPLPLQPFEVFSEVLASSDILLAVIERGAGEFSVPSKVLSYLCAGRPIVLAAPASNLAAKIVNESGAGRVVEPEDLEGFVAAALAYRDDPMGAAAAGRAGRQYAEENFQLTAFAERFETLFAAVVKKP